MRIERLKVSLNGGRNRQDHPAVPVTPAELAAAAVAAVRQACPAAGVEATAATALRVGRSSGGAHPWCGREPPAATGRGLADPLTKSYLRTNLPGLGMRWLSVPGVMYT